MQVKSKTELMYLFLMKLSFLSLVDLRWVLEMVRFYLYSSSIRRARYYTGTLLLKLGEGHRNTVETERERERENESNGEMR